MHCKEDIANWNQSKKQHYLSENTLNINMEEFENVY